MISQFYKCNANHNSFIIIPHYDTLDKKLFNCTKIKDICFKSTKQIVDGFILINIKKNKILMDYYNNDGNWETFCLNGLICCALIINKNLKKNNFEIISNDMKYKVEIMDSDFVKVEMKKPDYKEKNIIINNLCGNYLDSGAKHLVINYDSDWDRKDKLEIKMKKIRFNDLFEPDGINVNFYKEIDKGVIQVKTYEKGIEALMDSCASGSFACAYDYSKRNNIDKKIDIINDGGNSQVIFNQDYTMNFFLSSGKIEYKGELEI